MMNSKNYVETHGMKIITIFILIDLKKDQERYCVCNESKKTYLKATPQTKPF